MGPRKFWHGAIRPNCRRTNGWCSTVRKLVTIAFLMLKNNEPYQYARPALVHNKFTAL
jgi:4-hydroxy-3-methylbut-2-enyl diphosphate reductase IspH